MIIRSLLIGSCLMGFLQPLMAQQFVHGKGISAVELSYSNLDGIEHQTNAGYGRYLNNKVLLRFNAGYGFGSYNKVQQQSIQVGSRITYYPLQLHPVYLGLYTGLQGTYHNIDTKNILDTIRDAKRQITAYTLAGAEVEVFLVKDKLSLPIFTELHYSPISKFARVRWGLGIGLRYNIF